jgi:iron(III) transport system permease protein
VEAIRGRSLASVPGAVLGAALLGFLGLFVAWPVLGLLAAARDARGGAAIVLGLATTGAVAVVSTLATVGLAAALAWLAARSPGAPDRALVGAMLVPLLCPPFAAALALRFLLDAAGAAPASAAGGVVAVVAAQVATLLPHAFAILRNAMRGIDVEVEDAAVSLGAPQATALSRVTLRLLRPGLRCAGLAVLALALADVVTPLAVGGAAPFLGPQVVAFAREGDLGTAAAAALVLGMPAVAAWLGALRAGWARLGALPLAVAGPARTAAGAVRAATLIAAALALGGFYALVPLAALRTPGTLPLGALAASVRVAAAAAIVGTMLAFAFAVVAVRLPVRAGPGLGRSALAAAGVPGVALALGYVVAFDLAATGVPLWVPVVALAAWKLPAAVSLLAGRLRAHDPAVEEVAVSLGAGAVTIARRILAPLLGPALVAACLDLFVQALASASVLLVLAPHLSASASALTRLAAGDVAGSAMLVTGLAFVTAGTVLVRAWLAPREPLALLPA